MIQYLKVCERSDSRLCGWWKTLQQSEHEARYTQFFEYTQVSPGTWTGALRELDREVARDLAIGFRDPSATEPVLVDVGGDTVCRVDWTSPPRTLFVCGERRYYARFVHSRALRDELRKRNTLNVPMLMDRARAEMPPDAYRRFLRYHYSFQKRRRGLGRKPSLQQRIRELETKLRDIFLRKGVLTFDRYAENVKRSVVDTYAREARAIAGRWPKVPGVETSDGVYEELLSQLWNKV